MTTFPFVKKGDPFRPNVAFDNACRRIVNSVGNYGTPGRIGNVIAENKVQCYNATDSTMSAGSTVCFDESSDSIMNTILPVKICDYDFKAWGILENDLSPGSYGTVVLSGVAKVRYSGMDDFVIPDLNGGVQGSSMGSAQVLFRCSDGTAYVLLVGLDSYSTYNGPFAFSYTENGDLKVDNGYLNRNGKYIEVAETTISRSSITEGYICVISRFDASSNTWGDPIIEIAKPAADAYPIGYCYLDEKSPRGYSYECYKVPVAFIMYTKECPLAAKYNG